MPKFSSAQPARQLLAVRLLKATIVAVCLVGVVACSKTSGSPPAASAAAPPPAEVGVVTVTQGDVGLVTEVPGRLDASRSAQVRARAAGILQQR